MIREVTGSISSPIELASGQVTLTDRLAVILIRPTGSPTLILINWPPKPTVVEPLKLCKPLLPRSSRSWARRRSSTLRGEPLGYDPEPRLEVPKINSTDSSHLGHVPQRPHDEPQTEPPHIKCVVAPCGGVVE